MTPYSTPASSSAALARLNATGSSLSKMVTISSFGSGSGMRILSLLPLQPQRFNHLLVHPRRLAVFLPHHPEAATIIPHRPSDPVSLKRRAHVVNPLHARGLRRHAPVRAELIADERHAVRLAPCGSSIHLQLDALRVPVVEPVVLQVVAVARIGHLVE